jgi:ankyrin repeat protein
MLSLFSCIQIHHCCSFKNKGRIVSYLLSSGSDVHEIIECPKPEGWRVDLNGESTDQTFASSLFRLLGTLFVSGSEHLENINNLLYQNRFRGIAATPLHIAASLGDVALTMLLVDHYLANDFSGFSRYNAEGFVSPRRQSDARSQSGETVKLTRESRILLIPSPLHLASSKNHRKIVKLLSRGGAGTTTHLSLDFRSLDV